MRRYMYVAACLALLSVVIAGCAPTGGNKPASAVYGKEQIKQEMDLASQEINSILSQNK